MGTINGFGTGFRGWQHHADGSSTAPSWFLCGVLPVVPLRRYRLRTLTDFENESFGTPAQVAVAAMGAFSWSDPVAIEARLPLSWREIGMTYFRAYVLVPLLCLWPFGVLAIAMAILRSVRGEPLAKLPDAWVKVLIGVIMANFVAVLLVAARRMRGYPGSRLGRGRPEAQDAAGS